MCFFRVYIYTYRCTYAYHIRVQAIVDVEQTKFMTLSFSLYLEPQTTICKQLFQLDDEPNLCIGNGCLNQTSIHFKLEFLGFWRKLR